MLIIMKTNFILFITTILILTSCGGEFNKSVKTDLLTGLTSKGNGLSSSKVYLSIGDKKINRTTFVYGETFYVNFKDIRGLKKKGDNVFPGMEITVVSTNGDTAMYYDDMYADKTEGVNISPLFLYTNITVAKPMSSNQKYKLYIKIWDKIGEGTYNTTMDFDIVPNENIAIEKSDKINYDNVYLFSKQEGTIVQPKVKFNETYYMIFEGLTGFVTKNDKANVGLSMKATLTDGSVVFHEQDLLGDEAFEIALIKEQVTANFIFNDNTIKTPVTCEFVVYDKNSDAKVKASINLELD